MASNYNRFSESSSWYSSDDSFTSNEVDETIDPELSPFVKIADNRNTSSELTAKTPQVRTVLSGKPNHYKEEYEKLYDKWLGVVEEIDGDEINVRLFDQLNKSNPELHTTISKEQIDEEDSSLIQEGAVFYWSVGQRRPAGERQYGFSQIAFSRYTPLRSVDTINSIKDISHQYEEYFKDSSNPA